METSARSVVRFGLALLLLAPVAVSHAQASGEGYLFHRPYGSLTLRGGYVAANTDGQPFDIMRNQTTFGSRSFDAPSVGGEVSFFVSNRFEIGASLETSGRSKVAEYREWEENGKPIQNTSTLTKTAFYGQVRYNLVNRGRQIGSLAWIPARYVPYIGAGAGMMNYDLEQEGDFVEPTSDSTANIFHDNLRSWGSAPIAVGFTGLDVSLSERWSLLSEARYTHGSAKLAYDYLELGRMQLSGLAINFGARVRF